MEHLWGWLIDGIAPRFNLIDYNHPIIDGTPPAFVYSWNRSAIQQSRACIHSIINGMPPAFVYRWQGTGFNFLSILRCRNVLWNIYIYGVGTEMETESQSDSINNRMYGVGIENGGGVSSIFTLNY